MPIRIRLAAMVGVVLCWAAYGQAPAVRAERELFAAVNQARRAEGLAPLRWDESLAAAARRHAEVMAERGSAQHRFEGEPSLSARVKRTGAHFQLARGKRNSGADAGVHPHTVHAVASTSRQRSGSGDGFDWSGCGGAGRAVIRSRGFFAGAVTGRR
ncbi:MAG: CAP domain-containing protein [Terriglobales bacterium]